MVRRLVDNMVSSFSLCKGSWFCPSSLDFRACMHCMPSKNWQSGFIDHRHITSLKITTLFWPSPQISMYLNKSERVLLPLSFFISQVKNLQKTENDSMICIQHHPVATQGPPWPQAPLVLQLGHSTCRHHISRPAWSSMATLSVITWWWLARLSRKKNLPESPQKRRSNHISKKKEVEEPKPSQDVFFKKKSMSCLVGHPFPSKNGKSLLNWVDFPIPSSGGSQVTHPGQRWSPQPGVRRGRWLWGMKRKNVCLDETCTVEK